MPSLSAREATVDFASGSEAGNAAFGLARHRGSVVVVLSLMPDCRNDNRLLIDDMKEGDVPR